MGNGEMERNMGGVSTLSPTVTFMRGNLWMGTGSEKGSTPGLMAVITRGSGKKTK